LIHHLKLTRPNLFLFTFAQVYENLLALDIVILRIMTKLQSYCSGTKDSPMLFGMIAI
jgi:hypothetical protein